MEMLDVGVNNQSGDTNKDKWSRNNLEDKANSRESSHRVIRKFINSAIYVEKPLTATVSSENNSISQKASSEDLLLDVKTKICTCATDQKTCPCHCKNFFTFIPKETSRKSAVTTKIESKTKISQNYTNFDSEKESRLRKWIAKKEKEKKKRELEEQKLLEAKTREKEMLLEQERKNFKKWLMDKKKAEEEAKRKKKEKEQQELELKELEKEKRQLENQLNFQLWLKKKEEASLEKKIRKQMELIGEIERKEQSFRDNEKAFKEWLKSSKNKQKPIPLNRGLESLRSSTSVTYVNPTPWNPTI